MVSGWVVWMAGWVGGGAMGVVGRFQRNEIVVFIVFFAW